MAKACAPRVLNTRLPHFTTCCSSGPAPSTAACSARIVGSRPGGSMSNQASTMAAGRSKVRMMCPPLQLACPEGVAVAQAAAPQAALEPCRALPARAVRESLGHHHALAAPLQGVVADLRRSVQRLVDVAPV